jgi:hypothetical protein
VTELFDVGPEESVLGAILNAASFSKDAGHKVCDRVVETGLLPEMFYVRSYGALFHALVVQRLAGLPLDPVSVAAWPRGSVQTTPPRNGPHGSKHMVSHICRSSSRSIMDSANSLGDSIRAVINLGQTPVLSQKEEWTLLELHVLSPREIPMLPVQVSSFSCRSAAPSTGIDEPVLELTYEPPRNRLWILVRDDPLEARFNHGPPQVRW